MEKIDLERRATESFLKNLAAAVADDEELAGDTLREEGIDTEKFERDMRALFDERRREHFRSARIQAQATLATLKEIVDCSSKSYLEKFRSTSGCEALSAHFRKYAESVENNSESLERDFLLLNCWRDQSPSPLKALKRPETLISRLGIRDPRDIDLYGIAFECNALVDEKPLGSVEGRLIRNGERGLISVNSSITDKKKKRFIIAHELAHFFLHKEVSSISLCDDVSKIRVKTDLEGEANDFAADVIMPPSLLRQHAKDTNLSCSLLSRLADLFNVSLSAMAIQFASKSGLSVAVIFSQDGNIKWSSISPSFPLRSLRKSTHVPLKSKAGRYFESGNFNNEPLQLQSKVWFIDQLLSDRLFVEDCIKMPSLNGVLSLIWEEASDK
jgi:hypothetical protein